MDESANSLKSVEFTWKIANYNQQKLATGPGSYFSSRVFTVGREGDLEFTLNFYPQGYFSDEELGGGKWASLSLYTEGRKTYDTSLHVECSILDGDGEKFGSDHFHQITPLLEQDYGFFEFIRLTDLENPANNLLPNDTLTICCRAEEYQSESGKYNCLKEKPETPRARSKLCEDLASALDDKYADFVFKVENEKIAAHRVILAARSTVFAAMFQCDMKENKTNETEIEDMTPAAFRALLRFIYTGHCEVGNLAEQLLIAANKYDIQDLKEICVKELRMKLTVDNAVDLLILADLHQANDLKGGAILFINKNAAAVMKTPSWSDFPKTHPNLIFELYCKSIETK